jgi:nitroimidazol reductase NimA-like FMN-containing flavoprotein (pyridoxamine 5'-phosphate oxidase superfamily)
MNKGYKEENSWIWHITSVVCFGKIRFVNDKDEFVPLLRNIGNKYYPNKEEVEKEIEETINRVQILELNIEHMTGKLVKES